MMSVVLTVLIFIVAAAVTCFILYMLIKAAVRDGITEARQSPNPNDARDTVAEIICPECGKSHEMDDPKCPYCGHVNIGL